MDFATFMKLENVCKRAWRGLAKNGNDCKPNYLYKYESCCPACHIAIAARIRKDNGTDCRYCPIDKWRIVAKKEYNKSLSVGTCICLQFGQEYNEWIDNFTSRENRRKIAMAISKLKWTYLSCYKKIENL